MGTVTDIVEGWTNLFFGANEGIAKVRMEICRNCTHYKLGLCTKGCMCVMKAKTTILVKECPLKKW